MRPEFSLAALILFLMICHEGMSQPQEMQMNLPGDTTYTGQLKGLPVWTFHGAKDDVVPLSNTLDMVRVLERMGSPVRLTIYPEANHDAWTETYNNDDLYRWMLEPQR